MKRTALNRKTPLRRGGGTRKTAPKPKRQRGPSPQEWQATRAQVRARSGGRCEAQVTERCRAVGGNFNALGGEHQGHHRKLRSQGGGHGVVNVVAVCGWCHDWIHGHPAEARARGLICPRFHDPATWGLVLPDGAVVLLDRHGGYEPVMDPPAAESA